MPNQQQEQLYEDPHQLAFIQSRVATDYQLVDEYAAMMNDGVQFDPAAGLIDETGQVWVHDGLHRGEAAKQVGALLLVTVRPGSREEAEWLALAANQKHGLRRSRADKQRVVRQALLHQRGASLSDREIARHCGVDHKTVGRIRQELAASGEIPQIEKRTVTRGGQVYEQDTSQIGRSQLSPEQAEPEPALNGQSLHRVSPGQVVSAPNGGWDSTGPITEEETPGPNQAGQFDCPRCRREQIVKVNGGAWCLGCNTKWATPAEFLAELALAEPASQSGRALHTLTEAQLNQLLAGVIDRFVEFREREGQSERQAKAAAVSEAVARLGLKPARV